MPPRHRPKAGSIHTATARDPALVDLSQYLPILMFLGIALVLSTAFVVLPMVA